MTARTVSVLLVVGVTMATAPLAAPAQPAGMPWRIGVVRGSAPPPAELEALRHGLRERGYVEGRNLVIETRWADGREERLPALVAELLRLKVDLIVASAPAATRAAKDATTTTPIVMVTVADPLAFGFGRASPDPAATSRASCSCTPSSAESGSSS